MSGSHDIVVEDNVVAGNVYDKYGTRNPIAAAMMRGFLSSFRTLVRETHAREAHEVGCGEGHLAASLAALVDRVRASDFSQQIIERAKAQPGAERIDFAVKSVYDLDPDVDHADLIVCCEVLEHLEDPDRALAVLSQLARPHLIVSVPREPLWRGLNLARLKYVRRLGNTPGHVNHWSRRGFIRFLERHVDVEHVSTPLPWTMVRCRAR